jgi:serine/threonine-protein kinase
LPERFLGQTLGKYRVDAIIGSGGFAWVYKAYDPELDIPVALKVLKPQYAGDEAFEQRFRREASTAAKLRHPNIISIYAVGREGDAVYFAMDYLPQGLADRLNVMNTLPESMLIRMGIDVASALGFAHREGVIHRDIKTDNILFDDHGNAIVADFGIARAVSGYAEQTGTNMVVGTPQYFSPEQARGLQLDGRADLYSLGVTLYKAATGSLPFAGTDWYEIARQHVEEKPPKPRALNPQVSRELERIILQCLEKDPNDRFQSGEALAEELVRILAERGETAAIRTSSAVPAASTLSTPLPAPRFRRRFHRLKRTAWIAVGASLLVAIAAVAQFGRNESSAADRALSRADSAARGAPVRSTGGAALLPTRRVLSIDAPAGATVKLNTQVVSDTGDWESDTLPPGTYTIEASVSAVTGCTSSYARTVETLPDTGMLKVRITPRRCGQFSLNAHSTSRGGTYVIRSSLGERDRTGTLPLQTSLLLPEGRYVLVVEKRRCAQFVRQFTIAAGESNVIPVPELLCD